MQLKTLGTALNSIAAAAAQSMLTSPYQEGREAVGIVDCAAFNGTVKIQGSNDDGSSWTDLMTVTVAGVDQTVHRGLTLYRSMRANVTARTAGAVDVHLLSD